MSLKNENINKGLELNSLISLYKQTREDKYFNKLWDNVKSFAIMKGKRYPSIEFDDIISNSMECLWISLNNIKEGNNLLTYYGRILENRFYDIFNKKMQSKKYKMNSQSLSLEDLKEDVGYEPAKLDDTFNLEMFEYECKLIGIELTIVELIYTGFKQNEIIKKLEIDRKLYKNLLEEIKNKIKVNYLGEKVRI